MTDLRTRLTVGIIERLEALLDPPIWEPIQAADLDLIHQFFPRPKFFVFGHARSGTTLLARLLSLHPDLHCNWQGRFFSHQKDGLSRLTGRRIHEWLNHSSLHWLDGMNKEALVARAAIDMLLEGEAEQAGKPIVGDKTPNTNHGESLRRVYRLYPDARVLHIIRDGRDAILSMRIADFVDRPHLLTWRDRRIRGQMEVDAGAFGLGKRSLFQPRWLVRRAADWARNVSESTAMGPKLYPDRFCPLYYEQLLADPVGVTRRLWTFLDVDPSVIPAHEIQQIASENPKQEEHAQKAPGLVRGLPRGTRGVWRQFFTDGDVQRFHSQAELVLTQHGYPLDRFSEYPVRWTSTLEIERDSHE